MENKRIIVAIGGGSIAEKTTKDIDLYIANLAKRRSGEKRAYGLFVGTASHDSMPYFNSFRKTFTSVHDIKADCALTVYGEMDYEKIKGKFEKADFIYVGGGNTIFMLESWQKSGILQLILDAYNRGVIICGLSAGAICWFEKMYTDSDILNGGSEYKIYDGLNILKGMCCPHFNEREQDFTIALNNLDYDTDCFCLQNDSAIVFEDEKLTKVLSSGGSCFKIEYKNKQIKKIKL